MKKQHLIVLAVVLGILLGVRFAMHRRGSDVATSLGEAGIGQIVPASVDAAKPRWIRVTGPPPKEGEPGRPLELVKGDAGWIVVSAEGAPADESQVDDFLHRAVSLAGEVRGEGESTFARFGLAPDAATKVEIGEESGKPVATIWIGKQGDDADAHFARAEGSSEVRHCQDGLRAPLRLYADGAQPATDLWVNKVVHEADSKDLEEVTIERPDATFVLQRVPPAPPPPPPVDGASGEPAPEPAADEWRIVSPEMPWPVQSDSLDGVVTRSAGVRAASILAAGSPPCVFEPPTGRATFRKPDGTSTWIRLGGKVADKEEVALEVEGKPLCYGLATWSVQTLLPRASALWTIPQAFADASTAGEPTRVRYQRGGTTWSLARAESGEWTIESPAKGRADTSRCTRMSSAVKNLRIEDVAEASRVPAAALAVEATVTVQLAGRTLTVQVLGERAGGLGDRYVRFQAGTSLSPGWIAVVSKATADSLLPAGEQLKAAEDGTE